MPRKQQPPQPEDMLFMLVDSVMARLSPNAWKVVSYIASQHMRVQDDFFLRRANPAVFYLKRDLEQMGVDTVELPGEQRPYRSGGPMLPCACWTHEGPRFAVLSLAQICSGVRVKDRWQDHGTGLTKSSVAEAINEAIKAGIVIRERRKKVPRGATTPASTPSTGREFRSLTGSVEGWKRRKPGAPQKSSSWCPPCGQGKTGGQKAPPNLLEN